jgi:hypothetical protein
MTTRYQPAARARLPYLMARNCPSEVQQGAPHRPSQAAPELDLSAPIACVTPSPSVLPSVDADEYGDSNSCCPHPHKVIRPTGAAGQLRVSPPPPPDLQPRCGRPSPGPYPSRGRLARLDHQANRLTSRGSKSGHLLAVRTDRFVAVIAKTPRGKPCLDPPAPHPVGGWSKPPRGSCRAKASLVGVTGSNLWPLPCEDKHGRRLTSGVAAIPPPTLASGVVRVGCCCLAAACSPPAGGLAGG